VPIIPPQLDDLRFQLVLDQTLRLIPAHTPEWTDFNESDPGVTMIQLFAHMAEQIGYRLNRVPDKNYVEFLKLIGIRLRPAEAARTVLQFILARPENTDAFLVPAGSRVKAKAEGSAPVFETDVDLDALLWSFAPAERKRPATIADVPAITDESKAMAKELKRRGFKFLGPTTCYALMQATGMVDDHIATCFRADRD